MYLTTEASMPHSGNRQADASFRVTITPEVEGAIADALERAFDLFHWDAARAAKIAVEAIRDSMPRNARLRRKAGRTNSETRPRAL
jgi:hypothetical protein